VFNPPNILVKPFSKVPDYFLARVGLLVEFSAVDASFAFGSAATVFYTVLASFTFVRS
jgi:hypothetical protein